MPDDYHTFSKEQARKSIKSLMYEATNLTPSTLMELFEIDMTTATKGIQSSLVADGAQVGINFSSEELNFSDSLTKEQAEKLTDLQKAFGQKTNNSNVLRFHNNIKVFNSYIIWQGKTYYPAPIQAEGFDISSRGTLPTPVLRMTAQKEEGVQALSLLRRAIHKYGDIVGAKVTRIRTFAKYLDPDNFSSISQIDGKQGIYESNFPDQYEPDPYAEFPRDIFYVERKSNENKINLEYELSALIDVEGVKLPRRVVLSNKCGFTYRGCGCFYEQKESETFSSMSSSVTSSGWSKSLTSGAWGASQSHSAFAQASTTGSGTGALFSVVTDSGGIPTFTWVSGGLGYAVGDTLIFNDPYLSGESSVLYVSGVALDPKNQKIAGPGTTSRLLAKCEIRDSELALPDDAPPVATLSDEVIKSKLGVRALKNKGEWSPGRSYLKGDYIFVVKNNIKYYFVAREKIPGTIDKAGHHLKYAPPNSAYWVADMCSKTLQGCRKRWGPEGSVETAKTKDFSKGELQYGGFPNATRLDQTLR